MTLFLGVGSGEALANALAELTASECGAVEMRRFPDSESYVRVPPNVAGKIVFLTCELSRPDDKFLPLVFAARTVRELGAASVRLVAPYLPYLRQDRAFVEGEAVSSRIFAEMVSREFDELITVDPHLHRYSTLGEIYAVPTRVVRSAEVIGHWVAEAVDMPVIVGPDAESAQWAREIAHAAGAPWTTFAKERLGDHRVKLIAPPLASLKGQTPVLVDDIISSGATMIEAIKWLMAAGVDAPYCVAVHALFDQKTARRLAGLSQALLTTDAIPNDYDRFRIAPLIAEALAGPATEAD